MPRFGATITNEATEKNNHVNITNVFFFILSCAHFFSKPDKGSWKINTRTKVVVLNKRKRDPIMTSIRMIINVTAIQKPSLGEKNKLLKNKIIDPIVAKN